MFITCHSFIARQPLHIELPTMGVKAVNLFGDTMDKVLTRLLLVWVHKGLNSSLVISKDSQVLVGFIYNKLQSQGDPYKLGYIYYVGSFLAK